MRSKHDWEHDVTKACAAASYAAAHYVEAQHRLAAARCDEQLTFSAVEAAKAEVQAVKREIEAIRTARDAARSPVNDALPDEEASANQRRSAESATAAYVAALQAARRHLLEAQERLACAEQRLAESRRQLSIAESLFAEAERELADARSKLEGLLALAQLEASRSRRAVRTTAERFGDHFRRSAAERETEETFFHGLIAQITDALRALEDAVGGPKQREPHQHNPVSQFAPPSPPAGFSSMTPAVNAGPLNLPVPAPPWGPGAGRSLGRSPAES